MQSIFCWEILVKWKVLVFIFTFIDTEIQLSKFHWRCRIFRHCFFVSSHFFPLNNSSFRRLIFYLEAATANKNFGDCEILLNSLFAQLALNGIWKMKRTLRRNIIYSNVTWSFNLICFFCFTDGWKSFIALRLEKSTESSLSSIHDSGVRFHIGYEYI